MFHCLHLLLNAFKKSPLTLFFKFSYHIFSSYSFPSPNSSHIPSPYSPNFKFFLSLKTKQNLAHKQTKKPTNIKSPFCVSQYFQACPGVWLLYPVPLHCIKRIFLLLLVGGGTLCLFLFLHVGILSSLNTWESCACCRSVYDLWLGSVITLW